MLVHIGYGHYVESTKVFVVLDPGSSPVKKLRHEAAEEGFLVDATSGHKTRSIFQRYNITSEEDLRQAAQRLESHLKGIEESRQTSDSVGTNPGTIVDIRGN